MNSYISVLIADDDDDDAAFLNEALSQVMKAYKPSYAKDGVECLNFLKTNPTPELIFLDLRMPARSGMECLKMIRSNPTLDKTPVIIYSASHRISDIDKCYNLGANFYLVKPATLSGTVELLEQIFKALGKSKVEQRTKCEFVMRQLKEQLI